MKPTCDEILAVMNEIGKTITAKQFYHQHSACTQDYELSNGWWIRVFDECQSDWDYLEAVKPPGGEWITIIAEYPEENGYEDITNGYSPSKETLAALNLS